MVIDNISPARNLNLLNSVHNQNAQLPVKDIAAPDHGM